MHSWKIWICYHNNTFVNFQLPLNVISHGLAFHDHLAIEPESPYILGNYEIIKDMVLNREAVLNEAASEQASVSGTETETSVTELRRKAM